LTDHLFPSWERTSEPKQETMVSTSAPDPGGTPDEKKAGGPMPREGVGAAGRANAFLRHHQGREL
jgi:hypothetical protein